MCSTARRRTCARTAPHTILHLLHYSTQTTRITHLACHVRGVSASVRACVPGCGEGGEGEGGSSSSSEGGDSSSGEAGSEGGSREGGSGEGGDGSSGEGGSGRLRAAAARAVMAAAAVRAAAQERHLRGEDGGGV